jgi:hypothetical protein
LWVLPAPPGSGLLPCRPRRRCLPAAGRSCCGAVSCGGRGGRGPAPAPSVWRWVCPPWVFVWVAAGWVLAVVVAKCLAGRNPKPLLALAERVKPPRVTGRSRGEGRAALSAVGHRTLPRGGSNRVERGGLSGKKKNKIRTFTLTDIHPLRGKRTSASRTRSFK